MNAKPGRLPPPRLRLRGLAFGALLVGLGGLLVRRGRIRPATPGLGA